MSTITEVDASMERPEPPTQQDRISRRRWSFARRLGTSLLVVWLAYTLSFFLLWVVPGDAALARIGGEGGATELTPEQIEDLRADLGLDGPIHEQYFERLSALLTGDLGLSLRNDRPVTEIVGEAAPPTLALAALALAIAVAVGTVVAVVSNLTRIRWLRSLLISFPAVGMGVPSFWVGLLLIFAFSFNLELFPASGNEGFSALILPAVTLSLVPSAMIAQVFGTSLHESLQQVYATTTSPAKGAGKARVLLVHCVRNAAIPALTVGGVIVGHLLAGSVVVETIFSRPGIGRVMLDSVNVLDLPVVQAIVLLGAVVFVAVNLLIDLAYPLIDPRLRRRDSAATAMRGSVI